VKEMTGQCVHPPTYAEAEKIKLLTLHSCGYLKACLRDYSSSYSSWSSSNSTCSYYSSGNSFIFESIYPIIHVCNSCKISSVCHMSNWL